jgi:lysophospholipase L1-like esterase
LNALITADGQGGAIPIFANDVSQLGARVIVLGYYPISDQGGPFAPCRGELDELAARQSRMADLFPSVIFIDSGRVIGSGDIAAYAPDLVHPSPRGAALIGQLLASVIR